ncbi:MAG: hypothetical protein JNM38_02855 [Acidobacteria bacterium]|nr:hypothetical protein [Acidobacteriota bacterium]
MSHAGDATGGAMGAAWSLLGSVLRNGGWAPLSVFVAHLVLHRVVGLYAVWPSADVPMHLAGGMAIAYFLSAWFRTLPAFTATHRSQLLVEGVSVFALTVTVAVFWEFAEFLLDQTVGSNLQVSLANTMKDLAMGVSGAAVVTAWRVRGLRPHAAALRASAAAWVRGEMA